MRGWQITLRILVAQVETPLQTPVVVSCQCHSDDRQMCVDKQGSRAAFEQADVTNM